MNQALVQDVVDLDGGPPAADVLRDLVAHLLEARIGGRNGLAAVEAFCRSASRLVADEDPAEVRRRLIHPRLHARDHRRR